MGRIRYMACMFVIGHVDLGRPIPLPDSGSVTIVFISFAESTIWLR